MNISPSSLCASAPTDPLPIPGGSRLSPPPPCSRLQKILQDLVRQHSHSFSLDRNCKVVELEMEWKKLKSSPNQKRRKLKWGSTKPSKKKTQFKTKSQQFKPSVVERLVGVMKVRQR
ncbi:hypothetical protein ACFX2I_013663 [Malus domestica]